MSACRSPPRKQRDGAPDHLSLLRRRMRRLRGGRRAAGRPRPSGEFRAALFQRRGAQGHARAARSPHHADDERPGSELGPALDLIAAEFTRIRETHGPDAIAFYVSGQFLTEDYYVANKLMKGFIGSANIDTNSRLCMASSVAGHMRAFGEDVVPGCYEDLEEADLVVQVGSNMAWCHPVLYQRLMAAREKRGTKVVNIDPRRTVTAETADLHLPLAPGTDVLLFNGLLAYLADAGALDRRWIDAHVSGFEDALDAARRSAPSIEIVAAATDLASADVRAFYDLFARTERVVTLYSQGVNQSVERRRQGQRHPQLPSRCRTHRARRYGAVLADRTAECDGRARGRRPR